MERENGFYWVKLYGDWMVAEWDGDQWWIHAREIPVIEKAFTEINETKLNPPE